MFAQVSRSLSSLSIKSPMPSVLQRLSSRTLKGLPEGADSDLPLRQIALQAPPDVMTPFTQRLQVLRLQVCLMLRHNVDTTQSCVIMSCHDNRHDMQLLSSPHDTTISLFDIGVMSCHDNWHDMKLLSSPHDTTVDFFDIRVAWCRQSTWHRHIMSEIGSLGWHMQRSMYEPFHCEIFACLVVTYTIQQPAASPQPALQAGKEQPACFQRVSDMRFFWACGSCQHSSTMSMAIAELGVAILH